MQTVSEIQAQRQLYTRLNTLMFVRLLICVFAVAAILVIQAKIAPLPIKYAYAYFVVTFAIALNLVYAYMLFKGVNLNLLASIQIFVDVIIVSCLVYLVGTEGPFKFLYFACVISSAFLVGNIAPYYVWSLSVIMLSSISIGYHLHTAKIVTLPLIGEGMMLSYMAELGFLLPHLFFFWLSLLVVAFLSDLLVRELGRVRIFSKEILQNMADGVIAIDRTGKIIFVNQQAIQILPVPEKQEGKLYQDVLPQDIAKYIGQVIQNPGELEGEVILDERVLDIKITPVCDRKGYTRGYIMMVVDITSKKQAERAKIFMERFDVLVQMSRSMAHEIKNPISAIRTAAQEIDKTHPGSETSKKLMSILVKEIDRVNRIVSNFFEFAEDKPLELTRCDISNLIDETVELLLPKAREKGVSIKMDLDKDINIYCSPDKLRQVFLNLGFNAIESLSDGGSLTIRCFSKTNQQDEKLTVIEFEDSGTGIAPENLTRIFEPTFSTKKGGTGLGLAVAKKIVELHKGKISVSSKLNEGTKFVIEIPQA